MVGVSSVPFTGLTVGLGATTYDATVEDAVDPSAGAAGPADLLTFNIDNEDV